MDVWNYRGEGSWSFVALKRPGDERLFCARNNTTSKSAYTRQSYRKKVDGLWQPVKSPSDDFILNPKDKPKLVPVIDVPTVHEKDKATRDIFRPWFVLYLPDSLSASMEAHKTRLELINQLLNVATEGVMLFRKMSEQLTLVSSDSIIAGIAVANHNDATCMSSILDQDYYDTTREADAA